MLCTRSEEGYTLYPDKGSAFLLSAKNGYREIGRRKKTQTGWGYPNRKRPLKVSAVPLQTGKNQTKVEVLGAAHRRGILKKKTSSTAREST